MAHWLDGVGRIMQSPETNLIRLVEISGLDPVTIFQHLDLSGCDLRGQNLTGIDFTGAYLDGVVLDNGAIIDAKFDPRIELKNRYRFRVNRKTVDLINNEAINRNYVYAVWYVKAMFDMAINLSRHMPFIDIVKQVSQEEFSEYTDCDLFQNYRYRRVQLPKFVWEEVNKAYEFLPSKSRHSIILLSILIFQEIIGSGQSNAHIGLGNIVEHFRGKQRPGYYVSPF